MANEKQSLVNAEQKMKETEWTNYLSLDDAIAKLREINAEMHTFFLTNAT